MRVRMILDAVVVIVLWGSLLSGAKRSDVGTRSQTDAQKTYPESTDGLKDLLRNLFAAIKAGDKEKSAALQASFEIPNHAEWFLSTFGTSEGPRLDTKYTELGAKSAEWLKRRMEEAVKEGRTQIDVTPMIKPEDTPMRLMKAVLGGVTRPTTIYAASDSTGPEDKSPFYLGEFVYVDGGFRYLDRSVLQALSTAPPMRVRIGGNVQRARLVKEVSPQYPEEARAQKIRGTVALDVVIGTDGRVQQVQVVSGQPTLAQAAVDAVKQWVYQPTLLNGTPVEVETAIEVTFQH